MTPDPNFSSLWIASLALLFGLSTLVAGGESLISGASKLAGRLGMSPLLIGLTVVAFGTSMPELFVSIIATTQGHPDIMLGNVIGSNIANIGLILGLSALLYPLAIIFQRLALEFYLVIGASLIVFASGFFGLFPRLLGVFFSLALIIYTFLSYKNAHNEKKNAALSGASAPSTHYKAPYLLIVSLCLGGLILLWFGSDYFIKGAVDLARFFGLSELVIGLTIAAVGTSLPELASSFSAIRKKEGDILVGNILGSNLFNLLLVLGLTAAVKPFQIPDTALYRDLPIMTGFSAVLIPLALIRKKIKRRDGALLLAAYLFYIYLLA